MVMKSQFSTGNARSHRDASFLREKAKSLPSREKAPLGTGIPHAHE